MDTINVAFERQIYYAIINIIDGLALAKEPVSMVKFNYILDDLLAFIGDDIDDIADANDCNEYLNHNNIENPTWEDLVNAFKDLYKKGERL